MTDVFQWMSRCYNSQVDVSFSTQLSSEGREPCFLTAGMWLMFKCLNLKCSGWNDAPRNKRGDRGTFRSVLRTRRFRWSHLIWTGFIQSTWWRPDRDGQSSGPYLTIKVFTVLTTLPTCLLTKSLVPVMTQTSPFIKWHLYSLACSLAPEFPIAYLVLLILNNTICGNVIKSALLGIN